MTEEGAGSLSAAVARFKGFGDLYDAVRPSPPEELAEILRTHAGDEVSLVVDLGSGTGSSTRWAASWADEVIGIEPSDDMRRVAEARAPAHVSYRKAWSHETGLAAECADIVLAVQALHWMEPTATHAEVARLLGPRGVFAAIDCDWPPGVGDAEVEQEWDACRRTIRVLESRLASGEEGQLLRRPVSDEDRASIVYSGADAHREAHLSGALLSWSKSGHLDRMLASGLYGSCLELSVESTEAGDGSRFLGLMRSQGDYQTLRRAGLTDTELGLDRLSAVVANRLGGDPREFVFVYRIRLGSMAAASNS